jgi:beta-lactamase regulating signal transducer with metallopeptidase domain
VIAAGALAKGWLVLVAMAAAQGTLLALVALAITRVGRLRPAWQAGIWLVVIAKLALPWGPAMPWSLSDLIASFSDHPAADVGASLPPALRPAEAAPSMWIALGWLALAAIWLAGATLVIARAVRAQRRARLAIHAAVPASEATQQLVRELAAKLHVRAPRVVVGDDASGPHVLGIVRATIVVPPRLLDAPALLRAALLHELAHVRRRDGVGRVLQLAASALLFWWPVVRFVHRRLELAREAACDAYALEAGDVSRVAYARLLVQMAELRPAAVALASPRSLDARVAAVLGPPARSGLSMLHKLALAAWIAVALGGARRAEARGETCKYTPQLAEALYLAHPEADLDGDGTLSRDEACELQAELRRQAEQNVSRLDPESEALLSEPLCCNCDQAGVYSSPEDASCHSVEGVDR